MPLAKAAALPPDDPLHALAAVDPPSRLKSVTEWRQVGGEVWSELGVSLPVERLILERPPPWTPSTAVRFALDVGVTVPLG